MKRSVARLALALSLAAAIVPQHAQALTNYWQPVWFTWNTMDLDVFIIPPRHGQVVNGNGALGGGTATDMAAEMNPLTSSYTRAIMNSIKDWERAIIAYGSSALKTGFGCNATLKNCSKIHKYLIGVDVPPAGTRPEIVVTADEDKANILGLAVSSRPCLVLNSSFFIQSMTYEDMFGINAQEYGHCLGLAHVNEVNSQGGEVPLKHDPMNGAYADPPGQGGTDLHCVSNLNVKGLDEVFHDPLYGTPGADYGTITASSYTRPRYNAAAPTWGCVP